MKKGTGNTTTVILGVLIIICISTLIPIGLEGWYETYAPYEVYNETETKEESDTEAQGIKEDSESEIEKDANAISKLGEKDVICENGSSQQHGSTDSCNPYSDGTGFEDNRLVPSYKCNDYYRQSNR
jgi:hypothetical protein